MLFLDSYIRYLFLSIDNENMGIQKMEKDNYHNENLLCPKCLQGPDQ